MPDATTAKKEKGCFQCSRRRIVCDRTEPSCLKCAKKGIECSGLGRIRFAEGVARRGRLKNCKVPKAAGDADFQGLPTTTGFPALRWPGEARVKKREMSSLNERTPTEVVLPPSRNPSVHSPDVKPTSQALDIILSAKDNECDVEEIGRGQVLATTACAHGFNLAPWIAPIDPKLRMFFSYFSETVAPAMVVFDDASNGYRSIILPMALEDNLLCRSVAVVAAQHLSRQRPELQKAAEAGRAAIISRLRHDSLRQSADKIFNKFTWATLIVLLVGETVTGSADYRFFVQMLLSLSMSNSGRDDPSSSSFLQAQTHM
ncbi:hypothetical protein B5807_00029 [Epicoccum nigrum]|uniref:Zn(2)-C6 fungal-type domain-containing protein n=1 Tax=Epicoccum nigrum TaxID=105696 RepID=A0A1Y2MEC0_EPING|nr:hypothetical protein B5807_00029 [Epicoccum nigrum]